LGGAWWAGRYGGRALSSTEGNEQVEGGGGGEDEMRSEGAREVWTQEARLGEMNRGVVVVL